MQQLTIFEVTDQHIIPFEIGDIVRIVIPKYKRADPESFSTCRILRKGGVSSQK